MAINGRRAREQAARRRLIINTARQLAEAEGWDAVTTRRLSEEIEYSQPVLYKHFSGMDHLAEAVAIDGFAELAEVLSCARRGRRAPKATLKRIAHAYIEFADKNPALYDAMFTRATTLRFADTDTPPALSEAFHELRQAVTEIAGRQDVDTLAEVLWAALHGLVALNRAGRLRPGQHGARVELLINQFTHATHDAEPDRRAPPSQRSSRSISDS
ncbi:bacterial regulatory s, tetR family protein [Mycobacterium kansasii 732]|uniref:Bacterial regulatory s, tetR family protein n=1 Tax=Mycobacterium kansasii 662 TaxID=1299326 RepID=X7YZA9_MYCKA|nr:MULTISPECIES: TetR/AcrR family transcriptional regulator [Mycobacterium]EUA06200.1 bacterial regulatory s, tetR family protein [Mycobacterium kansasii 732]EUA12429.1 bacterial regulatory s, tetR family protein [Mycobacterium kansasii 662]MBY0390714.1 TetR/AcrR family transcriptional regulator [Mycobacterium pseudokansasii]VBA34013.1 Nucleoid occlusion factor SlmA [Mycobacterium pseudokansasii]VBA35476.1 Nucleoid occlusion factor SlmA [Mycobacterium pseudokansasii]